MQYRILHITNYIFHNTKRFCKRQKYICPMKNCVLHTTNCILHRTNRVFPMTQSVCDLKNTLFERKGAYTIYGRGLDFSTNRYFCRFKQLLHLFDHWLFQNCFAIKLFTFLRIVTGGYTTAITGFNILCGRRGLVSIR